MANRQDNALITAWVEGPLVASLLGSSPYQLGVFEDRTGGDSDSTSTRYPRGGMGVNEALGGRPETSEVTIMRLFDETARGYRKKLRQMAGKVTLGVNEQPIDDEGNFLGEPETWSGKLKSVKVSERKADSAAAATLELTMVPQGGAT